MNCPYHSLGWKECQAAKKKERKMLEQINHMIKQLISARKADIEKAKKYFGPGVSCVAMIMILYSLTGIASMFYAK